MRNHPVRSVLSFVLIVVLFVSPVFGHGQEKHAEPERVTPSTKQQKNEDDTQPEARRAGETEPARNKDKSKLDEGVVPDEPNPEADRKRVREAMGQKDRRALWKILATGLMIFGLVVVYWPGMEGGSK